MNANEIWPDVEQSNLIFNLRAYSHPEGGVRVQLYESNDVETFSLVSIDASNDTFERVKTDMNEVLEGLRDRVLS